MHNRERATLENMDVLPFVTDVYKRDLVIEDYFIGYLLHPVRLALHGARLPVALHVLPVAADDRRAPLPDAESRERGRGDRAGEGLFPQVKEFFFDDDTFTDDLPRAEEIARRLGKLGVTWSCNAKAIVPYETLKIMKDNGLRLLLVGYETGSQQILNNIRKGTRIDVARRFTEDCHRARHHDPRHVHRGPAGRDARDDPRNDPLCPRDQSAHDPGVARGPLSRHRALPAGARTAGSRRPSRSWPTTGCRSAALAIRTCRTTEIFEALEEFYKRFYFRPRKMRRDDRGDGDEPRDDEAAPARRGRVRELPLEREDRA